MNASIRRFAVSGSAVVALLGGATAITFVTSEPAAAAASESVVERAVTAPVTLPDGRTIRIAGMGGYGHRGTAEHIATVATFRADTNPGGITNGLTPDNNSSSADLINPQNTGINPQQIQTQAGGGTIGVTVAVGIGLLIGVIVMIKRGSVRVLPAVMSVALGVYLAPTFVGPLVQQLGGSLGSGLGNVWAGF